MATLVHTLFPEYNKKEKKILQECMCRMMLGIWQFTLPIVAPFLAGVDIYMDNSAANAIAISISSFLIIFLIQYGLNALPETIVFPFYKINSWEACILYKPSFSIIGWSTLLYGIGKLGSLPDFICFNLSLIGGCIAVVPIFD